MCKKCSNHCRVCHNSKICTLCYSQTDYYLKYGNCIAKGRILNRILENTCLAGDCEKCEYDNPLHCYDCKSNFYLHDKKCVKLCPKGTFIEKKECSPCQEGITIN